MAKDLYDKLIEEEKRGEGRDSKKLLALAVVVIIIIAGVAVSIFYLGTGGEVETVNNEEQAADTLSDMGNDLSGISNDLKDIENIL